MAELTPELLAGLPKNGPTDPIEYYRRPLVGWLFRERINLGLRLLPQGRFARALEVGYGAGAVQLALSEHADELHGIDLDADPEPVERLLASRGVGARLVRGSVYELPYENDSFDLVVCFSVFEHLHEYGRGLAEVARVLKPGGHFLLGMPAVNVAMEYAFRAIGFKGIDDHHVTAPATVMAEFGANGLRLRDRAYLGAPADWPLGPRLYYNWLLRKDGAALRRASPPHVVALSQVPGVRRFEPLAQPHLGAKPEGA
jgi:SAM-dependent methyltransferase